jgi:flagellar L-ring protein precursor FlgH
MRNSRRLILGMGLLCSATLLAEKPAPAELSPLDRYIAEAGARPAHEQANSAGSLFHPGAQLADLARDLRAAQIDDVVTILIAERASAVAKGTTASSRKSDAKFAVGAIFGPTKAAGALANLASGGGETQLQGQGETSRESTLSTTLSGRVTHVMPNGNLVIEGIKLVEVNSERQQVSVRGVVRPADIRPGNVVRSDSLSQLEVRINGKGVVGDAIRRPFFLYRLLLGLLPF